MSETNSAKRTLEALPAEALEGQRAVVRVDFNVPLADGAVADDTRIQASLPTIRWLQRWGCRVILLSHLGRPRGRVTPEYSLRPVAAALEDELGVPITFIDDPRSDDARAVSRHLKRGEIALVENTRFLDGEETNDPAVAEILASLGDFYVNDAFGAAHRAHASTAGIAALLSPAVAGFLMARELEILGKALTAPGRPFVAIIGGAKISGKIDVLDALLPKVDRILIGGAMACTFFAAMGYGVGHSLVEPDKISLAEALLERAEDKIVLPTGGTIAQEMRTDAETREVPRDAIPDGWAVYDLDAASSALFAETIRTAATVLWNGPMGVFEIPPFDAGTRAVAAAMADATSRGATTIVGGGDSAAAIAQAGLQDAVTHVSTGGGASLEFLQGKPLPGVAALDDA